MSDLAAPEIPVDRDIDISKMQVSDELAIQITGDEYSGMGSFHVLQ